MMPMRTRSLAANSREAAAAVAPAKRLRRVTSFIILLPYARYIGYNSGPAVDRPKAYSTQPASEGHAHGDLGVTRRARAGRQKKRRIHLGAGLVELRRRVDPVKLRMVERIVGFESHHSLYPTLLKRNRAVKREIPVLRSGAGHG